MADHWWWRPGWRPGRRMYAWHFTFGDQPGVGELAAGYQARLAGLPGLDPVPAEWLHLTTADVGFADEVTGRAMAVAAGNARRRLAGFGPAEVTIGPAHVVAESVVLNLAGPSAAGPEAGFWPHVTVAYSHCTAPAAPYAAAVAGRAEATSVRLDAVRLIVLGRDQRCHTWTVRDTIELPGRAS
jgi:2'-5' RNA ligase